MLDIDNLRLTDMKDFRLIPQLVEDMHTQYIKEQETYICKKLFDLHIDKDILKNQIQEIERLNDNLRKYADLEEKGLLLKLPCKVGDIIWWLNGKFIMESEVVGFSVCEDDVSLIRAEYQDKRTDKTYMYTLDTIDIGKTVFLTKEEAEQALLKRLESAE